MKSPEIKRRLREAIATKGTTVIAEACGVDARTVRNWRDGRLPKSRAIIENLTAYLARVTA